MHVRVYHRCQNVTVALLRACRQIYREAAPILYGMNSFYCPSLNVGLWFSKIGPRYSASLEDVLVVFNFQENPDGDPARLLELVTKRYMALADCGIHLSVNILSLGLGGHVYTYRALEAMVNAEEVVEETDP